MRPQLLYPLFAPIGTLRGVGPKIAKLIEKLCGPFVVDALWHLPVAVIDRRLSPLLEHAVPDTIVTLTLDVLDHAPPAMRGRPYKIYATDGSREITLTYFNVKGDYLDKIYEIGRKVVVSGKLERFAGEWTMSHPDYAVPPEKADEIPRLETVYGLTHGLGGKVMRKIVADALTKLPVLPEWHDTALLNRESWPPFTDALRKVHTPTAPLSETTGDPCRRRLAYDEVLADQLALALIRQKHKSLPGRALKPTGRLTQALRAALPFSLTAGQEQAIAEITNDCASSFRMLRLLQGDVGSGKTIIALFAMLAAVEDGLQAALMAPTEILAKQLYERISAFLQPLNDPALTVGLLTGKAKSAERKKILEGLASGTLKIAIGTHALFQEDVRFAALGLAIIDEQHRFGVHQRLMLSEKGKQADVLVMTATPIPRTLTMTVYGDMDVSRVTDKPPGRKPIDTRIVDVDRLTEVIAGLKREIAKGARAYWVCPLIDESEKIDLAAATDRAQMLREHLGEEKIGLLHGRMKPDEKERIMAGFQDGTYAVLVATTVIEVGVDVPEATLMIIEHAERFGLAALHQLRGRVGRGGDKSTCLLVYQGPLSPTAKTRLLRMRETEDGFLLAEEDLRLRGPGEMLGTRQSGLPAYRLADFERDADLMEMAKKNASLIIARHNETTALTEPLRILLYLFQKDSAVHLPKAG